MVEIKQRQAPKLAFALSEVVHVADGGHHVNREDARLSRFRGALLLQLCRKPHLQVNTTTEILVEYSSGTKKIAA